MSAALARPRFKAVHEAHAIEQVVIAIQFAQQVDESKLAACHQASAALEGELPISSVIRGFELQVSPHGLEHLPNSHHAPSGFIRALQDQRGVVLKELKLDRQALLFTTRAYSRWDKVWGDAQNYFRVILGALGDVPVQAYSLSYLDKFVWDGDSLQDCSPKLLLNEGCRFISNSIFSADDLWHSYCGEFIKATSETKRLRVVNLDCLDETDASSFHPRTNRVIRISTTLTDMFNQQGYASCLFYSNSHFDDLSVRFDSLHSSLKSIFSEIVNEQTAKSIGLNVDAN